MVQAATFKTGGWPNERRIFLALAAIAIGALATAMWATWSINPLRGDSAEYLYFDRSRSVGYPAFLELVRLLTGCVALAVPIQMAMLAASLLALGAAFYRHCGRPIASLLFMAAITLQPGIWFASAFLMAEALSTALVALWLARLLCVSRIPSSGDAAMLTLVGVAATVVRPPLIALLVGSAILFMETLTGRDRTRALLMTVAGAIAAWAATPAAQLLVHGTTATTSPVARGVLQHTLYCGIGSPPRDPDAALIEEVSAPVRRYISSAPSAVREQLRREYSTPLRFGLIIPALGRRHGLDRRSAVELYLTPIARERVAANPLCYARGVAREYLRMAMFDTDPTLEDGRRLGAFAGAHPPPGLPQLPVLKGDEQMARRAAAEVGSPPAGLNPPRYHLNVVAKVPLVALLPFRLAFAAAALIGAVAALALLFRRRIAVMADLAPVAAMGVAFHDLLLITAIVEIGFFRYLVPLWPIVCTLIALAALAFTSRSRQAGTDHDS